MTVYTALIAITATVSPIIKANEGRIGTHSPTCYEHHAACLALLIRDVIDEEMKA